MTTAGREAAADADALDGDRAVAPRSAESVAADPERGIRIVTETAKSAPASPGVYRMLGGDGEVLYVGKARALKRRVAQYAQFNRLPSRLQRMVSETQSMELVKTHTEVEALLLESNYIKKLRPRYNILLRDDKSFPYILIRTDHDFPQIVKHRGAKSRKGEYFGPFASGGAVNRTLTALQKAFLLRPCSDAIFNARTRPCLQHQIKRCSAPCVDRIGKADYAAMVDEARGFLADGSRQVQDAMAERMQAASDALDFETAARYRDRIRALTYVQGSQSVNIPDLGDADVFAIAAVAGRSAVEAFFYRGGRNYGALAFFPSHDAEAEPDAILAAFLAQFYEDKTPPPTILVSETPCEVDLLAEALSLRAERKVKISTPQRGEKADLVRQAGVNAADALARKSNEAAGQRRLLSAVADAFGLDQPPQRIDVFDNSHLGGTDAYGAMIVAGPEGLMKGAYRKFSIKGPVEPGDDYAMTREVIGRRYARAAREDPDRDAGDWPDLILVDGGRGQLNAALEALAEIGIDDLPVVGVAKGPDRNAGRERFFQPGRAPFDLPPRDPALHFLQRLRDEAHRFAIGAHRARRAKKISETALDDVPGVGPTRKRALLRHFGSARAVQRAALADLEKAPGVSKALAARIYGYFHHQE